MYFFTADEHYGHKNIIRFCSRPFATVDEMDAELTRRHNEVVGPNAIVIHAGVFTLANKAKANRYIGQLAGEHIFVRGSHDRWMTDPKFDIWHETIEEQFVVVCHYVMRTWPRSHHNSWQLYGHSHGRLEPVGKQWDIGVDNNDFTPVSFPQIRRIMEDRPDNGAGTGY